MSSAQRKKKKMTVAHQATTPPMATMNQPFEALSGVGRGPAIVHLFQNQ